MSEIRDTGRQPVLSTGPLRFTYADLANVVAKAAADLPANALIVGGEVVITTPWNDSGTAVLDVGDSGVADRYKSGVDLKAAGRTALVPTGYRYEVPGTVSLTPTYENDDNSAGAGYLLLRFIFVGRASEHVFLARLAATVSVPEDLLTEGGDTLETEAGEPLTTE